MYSPINPKVEALAFMLAQHFQSPFPDGLVMRLGEGWEGNNIEAISSWRRANEEMTGTGLFIDESKCDVHREKSITDTIEEAANRLSQHLQDQVEQIWNRQPCPFPSPQPFMPLVKLTHTEGMKMAHALLEILAGGLPLTTLEHHCLMSLPGEGDASHRLAQWIDEQAAQYVYHPSELTLPLAHDLVSSLFNDFYP